MHARGDAQELAGRDHRSDTVDHDLKRSMLDQQMRLCCLVTMSRYHRADRHVVSRRPIAEIAAVIGDQFGAIARDNECLAAQS